MVDLSYSPEAAATLRAHTNADIYPPDRGRLLQIIHDYVALWCHTESKIDKQVLDSAEKLTLINTASTGTDHIDKEEVARRDITVLSITRVYGLLNEFTGVAEYAWMLVIAGFRNFRTAMNHVLAGGWSDEDVCGNALWGSCRSPASFTTPQGPESAP